MTKNYLKQVLLAAGLLSAVSVSAVDLPFAQAPADGKTYILVSRLKPASLVRTTTWDGALFLNAAYDLAEQQKAAMTAQQNEDGTWSFYQVTTVTPEDDEPYTETI